jgi:hypothetical protein
LLRAMVNTFAPGPAIVRLLAIASSPLVNVMVDRPGAKSIVSPAVAAAIAWRSVQLVPGARAAGVRAARHRDRRGMKRRGARKTATSATNIAIGHRAGGWSVLDMRTSHVGFPRSETLRPHRFGCSGRPAKDSGSAASRRLKV